MQPYRPIAPEMNHLRPEVHHLRPHYDGMDARICGSTWTNVKTDFDKFDRHELFLLGEGERKVEMEVVTRKSSDLLLY